MATRAGLAFQLVPKSRTLARFRSAGRLRVSAQPDACAFPLSRTLTRYRSAGHKLYTAWKFDLNYLAHAYQHLDDPYFVAGTALPDWMSVIDRKNRPRRQYAEPIVGHSDPRFDAVARGCLQHHADDFWFHQSQAFVTLSTQFAVELRGLLAEGMGHQAGFVGHIAVELLLDAVLIERSPDLLDQYYAVLNSLEAAHVQAAANAICRQPVTQLVELLPRFIEVRFLQQYVQDESLLRSLNGVMRRIGLPLLPANVTPWLGEARVRVTASCDQLLSGQP